MNRLGNKLFSTIIALAHFGVAARRLRRRRFAHQRAAAAGRDRKRPRRRTPGRSPTRRSGSRFPCRRRRARAAPSELRLVVDDQGRLHAEQRDDRRHERREVATFNTTQPRREGRHAQQRDVPRSRAVDLHADDQAAAGHRQPHDARAQDNSNNILSQQISTSPSSPATRQQLHRHARRERQDDDRSAAPEAVRRVRSAPHSDRSVPRRITFTVATTDPAAKSIIATGPADPSDRGQHRDVHNRRPARSTVPAGPFRSRSTRPLKRSPSRRPTARRRTHRSTSRRSRRTRTRTSRRPRRLHPTLKTFAFSTGTAPPTHNFIAVGRTDHAGRRPGRLLQRHARRQYRRLRHVLRVLAGDARGDGVDQRAPASTTSTIPQDLRWDTTGDLLIANGGGATGDNGNFACVPLGAIATGANSATTVTDERRRSGSLALRQPQRHARGREQPVELPEAVGRVRADRELHRVDQQS